MRNYKGYTEEDIRIAAGGLAKRNGKIGNLSAEPKDVQEFWFDSAYIRLKLQKAKAPKGKEVYTLGHILDSIL